MIRIFYTSTRGQYGFIYPNIENTLFEDADRPLTTTRAGLIDPNRERRLIAYEIPTSQAKELNIDIPILWNVLEGNILGW